MQARPLHIGPDGWAALDFNDSNWHAATSFGKPPIAPWGHIKLK